MDQSILISSLLVASSVFLAVFGAAAVYTQRERNRIVDRLHEVPMQDEEEEQFALLRDTKLSSVPLLNNLLSNLKIGNQLELLLLQADVSMKVGAFFLTILVSGGVVGLVVYSVLNSALLILPAFFLGAVVPIVILNHRKQKRVHAFERQFPDALDLMTGALRSGLAFSGALQMVAEESPDPVGSEFMIVFEEHRLGLGLRESLKNLSRRIDSQELRLFTTAVLLQRDTGGNLAEILEGAADVIRDRFRILGDVRTVTAQGRLSGIILSILPLAMATFLFFAAPDYLRVLVDDPVGPYLIGSAVVLQIIGFLAIRRIINIKV